MPIIQDSPSWGQRTFGNGFNGNQFASGAGELLGGLFNDSSAPYKAAQEAYNPYVNKAVESQNPFYKAGTTAIPDYQHWLGKMQDPSSFINNIMSNYHESPWAKYQQEQGIRAAQNLGSASGLTGSTPLMQQAQQNAQNISSGDMNQWLQNVLGINTAYGAGEKGLIDTGQTAGTNLSNIYQKQGENNAGYEYNKEYGKNFDFSNILGGVASIGSMFL